MMKKLISVLFIFLFLKENAQSDSINYTKKEFTNYYAPFHPTIQDTAGKSVVSKIGVYVSVAIGSGNILGIYPNPVALLSCSVAYKSHLFTLTRAGYGQLIYGGSEGETTFNANYIGLLYGQSMRFKYAMVSLSAGLAYSRILISDNLSWIPPIVSYQGISFPVELKVFLHARNGIGLGIHVAKNIIFPYQNSPFYFGVAIVFGSWNTIKKTNFN